MTSSQRNSESKAKHGFKGLLVATLPPSCIAVLKTLKRPYTFWRLRRDLRRELSQAFEHDEQRFARNSAACRLLSNPEGFALTEGQHHAVLSIAYHRLEKALSFSEPRPGFGVGIAQELCLSLEEYISRFGHHAICDTCVEVLSDYARFNKAHGRPAGNVEEWLSKMKAAGFGKPSDFDGEGGGATVKTSRLEIQAAAKMDLSAFFRSRHSIRNFAAGGVATEQVTRAISQARWAPSVCNRQSARVYLLQGAEICRQALALQNGNRGFGHSVETVLIVTSDIQCFASVDERNQCWIDGALFAMSLVYALHSEGLGTCCLNWCTSTDTDRKLHTATEIPESEVVIMMIAVGHIADELHVARSRRLAFDEIVRFRPGPGDKTQFTS